MATSNTARALLMEAATGSAAGAAVSEESPAADAGWPEFDQIVFAFPSIGRSSVSGAKANQELLRAFFSQAALLLRTQTKAAAVAGATAATRLRLQPAVRVALHKSPYFDSWRCDQLGQDARLRFTGLEPFVAGDYPGYAPEATQHSLKVSLATGGLEGGVSSASADAVWYTFTHSKFSAKAAIRARGGMTMQPKPPPALAATKGAASKASPVASSAFAGKRGRPGTSTPAMAAAPGALGAGGESGNGRAAARRKGRAPAAGTPMPDEGMASPGKARLPLGKRARVKSHGSADESVAATPREDPAVAAALLAARFMRS